MQTQIDQGQFALDQPIYILFKFKLASEAHHREFVLSNFRISEALLFLLDLPGTIHGEDLVKFFLFASKNKITKLGNLSSFSYENEIASRIPHQFLCQILHCYLVDPLSIPASNKIIAEIPFILH